MFTSLKRASVITSVALMLLSLSTVAADNFPVFREGVDFTELRSDAAAVSTNESVILVFWYGSESSFQVLSALSQSAYTEQLILWPAVFRENWRQAGKLTLYAKLLDFSPQQHLALMQKVIVEQPNLTENRAKQDILVKLLRQKPNALTEQDNLDERLELVLRDPSVPKELKSIQSRLSDYPISSVPTIIFKGKFVISAEQAKTGRRLVQILDFLNQRQYQLTNESGSQ